MLTFVGPDLLIDLGAADEALKIIEEAAAWPRSAVRCCLQGAARLAEIKFQLRVHDDPAAAHLSLSAPELRRAAAGFPFIHEAACGLARSRLPQARS